MDKLKMAHEWAMKSFLTHGFKDEEERSVHAWKYADAMQAEAEKRKPSGLPDALKEEWQPDWSKAPDGYNWFCVGSNDGYGFFSNQAPELFDDYYFVGADGFVVNNHGYQGNWKNSLRKRPQ